jgi:hypothetical protein
LPSELEHAQKCVQLFQTAVSDRKTLRGLTQFVRRVSTPPSVSRSIKKLFQEPHDLKDGFALHRSRPLVTC